MTELSLLILVFKNKFELVSKSIRSIQGTFKYMIFKMIKEEHECILYEIIRLNHLFFSKNLLVIGVKF
jgi:hypothetical protein